MNWLQRILHRFDFVHHPIKDEVPLTGHCKSCGRIVDFDNDPWSMGWYNWRKA